jgi:hypothetical protein
MSKVVALPTEADRYDASVRACTTALDTTLDRLAKKHGAHIATAALIAHLGASMREMRRLKIGGAEWKIHLRLYREARR